MHHVVGVHVAAGDEQLHVDLVLDALGPGAGFSFHGRVDAAFLALEERLLAELIASVLAREDGALAFGIESELARRADFGEHRVEGRKLRGFRGVVVSGFKIHDEVAGDFAFEVGNYLVDDGLIRLWHLRVGEAGLDGPRDGLERIWIDVILHRPAPDERADCAGGFALIRPEHVGDASARLVNGIFGTEIKRVDGVVAGSKRLIELIGGELERSGAERAAGKLVDGGIHVFGVQYERELIVEQGFDCDFGGFFFGGIFQGDEGVLGGELKRGLATEARPTKTDRARTAPAND